MSMHQLRTCSNPIVALLAMLAMTLGAHAQESFRATHATTLDATQEVSEPDDQVANGVAVFRVDRDAATLEYRVSVTGISGITGAHIHRGPAGEDGPVVFPIGITDQMHTAAGVVTGLRTSFIDSLLAGNAYVNVHTTTNQAGHVRGQIIEMPNAVSPTMTTVGEPHEVTGDSGVGSVVMFIDEGTRTARYHIDWEKLTGRATNAHFHLGPPGQSGPPVHTITLPDDTSETNASGVWQMSPEHLNALKEGNIYANVHTAINPQGEIRGMVMPADFYAAAVSASNEVPDHSDSSTGIGTATAVVLRAPFGGVVFVKSAVDHTTGPVSMAHVHRGAIGQNGPVAVPLTVGSAPGNWNVTAGPISIEDIATFAATGMYANYHTELFQLGEIRGQFIAGEGNLSLTPSAVPPDVSNASAMNVWNDRANDRIVVSLAGGPRRGGAIELFTASGERVASVEAASGVVSVPTTGIPAGAYFARLVVDGRVAATAPVAVW